MTFLEEMIFRSSNVQHLEYEECSRKWTKFPHTESGLVMIMVQASSFSYIQKRILNQLLGPYKSLLWVL